MTKTRTVIEPYNVIFDGETYEVRGIRRDYDVYQRSFFKSTLCIASLALIEDCKKKGLRYHPEVILYESTRKGYNLTAQVNLEANSVDVKSVLEICMLVKGMNPDRVLDRKGKMVE